MIQDILPYHPKNEYAEQNSKGPDSRSLLILREGNSLWCRIREGVLELPPAGILREAFPSEAPEKENLSASEQKNGKSMLRYLIAVDEVRFYMPAEETEFTETVRPLLKEQGYGPVPAGELRYAVPAWLRFGALTAWQAAGWYQNNRFCGRCGEPMVSGSGERSLVCPSCGNTLYPKLCPVIIAGVVSGNRILLTRYAGRDRYARFALVAGFAEIGETIEQTVAREVMEETGLKVRNLRYYKSQPWAYSESLLFGFYCDVDGPDEVTVDQNELSTAVWTERQDIPDYGDEISLTYEMMRVFREGKEPRQQTGSGGKTD